MRGEKGGGEREEMGVREKVGEGGEMTGERKIKERWRGGGSKKKYSFRNHIPKKQVKLRPLTIFRYLHSTGECGWKGKGGKN